MNPKIKRTIAAISFLSMLAAPRILPAADAPSSVPRVSEGQVVALADGKPIAGATVNFFDDSAGSAGTPRPAPATTDAQGRFRIPTSSERGVLFVQAGSFGTCVINTPTGPDQDPLTIPLKPAASVRVKLTAPDGKPAPGVRVAVQAIRDPYPGGSVPDSIRDKFTRQSDASGICILDGLPQDAQIAFEIADERYVRILATAQTGGAQPTDASPIQLEPAGLIEGRLTFSDTGQPAPNIRIVDRSTADGFMGYMAYANTDAQGRFRLIQLRAGTHTIIPEIGPPLSSRYAAQNPPGIPLAAGQQLKDQNFTLVPGVPVRGKVTVADTGKPVDGATVLARPSP